MFKRVSLAGSAELLRESSSAPEILAETEPEPVPAPIHRLPIQHEVQRESRESVPEYEYRLTEPQVRALVEAVQRLKYPHTVKSPAKLSMEEFERLEALRQLLLDGLR